MTSHFGRWESEGGRKPVWVMLSDFLYARVIKHQRRCRTVEVELRMLVGEEGEYRKRLKAGGQSGRINNPFIERLNLTIRQSVSKLTWRTRGPAIYACEQVEHLEWWRMYYHYVRYHESLKVKLGQPEARKGKRQSKRYRRRTPAMAAGLVSRRWTVRALLSIPLL